MDVFLFPMMNVTLFPKTTKRLSIFEPRYIEMFRYAAENKIPVAIGFNEDPSTAASSVSPGQRVSFVHEIAGFGIANIVEERPNGTIVVFLHGQGKVKLGPSKETEFPFIVCESEAIEENVIVDPKSQPAIQALNSILARWIHGHIPDPSDREIFMRNLNGPEEIVAAFTSYLVRDFDFQQMILELNDINDKIYYLHRLAESNEIAY